MEEEGGARRGRPARPVEGGRRRKAEQRGAGQRRVEREDGGGGRYRVQQGGGGDDGADGGGATGVRGQTDRRGLSGCVCEWIRMEKMREMNGLAVALFRKRRYC